MKMPGRKKKTNAAGQNEANPQNESVSRADADGQSVAGPQDELNAQNESAPRVGSGEQIEANPQAELNTQNASGESEEVKAAGENKKTRFGFKKDKAPKVVLSKEEKAAKKQEKKAANAAKKQEKQKQKQQAQGAKAPKGTKPAKQKKPKLTKEEKLQVKNEHRAQKTRLKAAKIRSVGLRRAEKIRVKKERTSEKKQIKKNAKSEQKQFEKSLRDEIKQAKKDVPRNYVPIIVIPIVAVLILTFLTFFLSGRGIGPFAALNLPDPINAVKSIKIPKPELPSFIKSIKLPDISFPWYGDSAEETVEGMFTSLQALDFEAANEYVDMSAITIPEEYIELVDTETIMHSIFDKLTFEILSEAEKIEIPETEIPEGETPDSEEPAPEYYGVTVNVTAPYIKPLMATLTTGYLQYEYDNILSHKTPTATEADEKIIAMFDELTSKAGVETVSNEITVKVERISSKIWEVVPDDDFINAVFGGVIDVKGDFFAPDPPAPAEPAEPATPAESGSSH